MATNPIDQRVADNVRAEMARHNLSQSRLAAQLHWTQQGLSRRLSARVSFGVSELHDIADTLEVPVTYLLGAREMTA